MVTPFHVAVQVRDLTEAKAFYEDVIGCEKGRSGDRWVDLNLFGHQFVCHLNPELGPEGKVSNYLNPVDGHGVPVPHFGVVMKMPQWEALANRLKSKGVKFLIEPYMRFRDRGGQQATMFLLDPSGNALEFKAFEDIEKELFKA